jgi:hypothetical protein
MISIVYNLELVFDIMTHPQTFLLSTTSLYTTPYVIHSRCQRLLLIVILVVLLLPLPLFDRIHHHGHH